MTPAYGAGTLLTIAALAVAVLLLLIIVLRMHAFVALVLVSLGTAVAAGVPLADVPAISIAAFGSTLGNVALLVGLGVMIGRILEVTGGAQVLADTLVSRFGEKRAPLALGVAALLFGMPIFFDAGLVVFLPIIFSVAKRFGGSVLMYALPAAGAFAAMHAIVPPHPGPVTAATEIDASIGLTLLVGVVVAVVAWIVGVYVVTTAWLGKVDVPIDDSVLTGGREADTANPPGFAHVLGILLLPVLLIAANTIFTTLRTNGSIAEDGVLVDALIFTGQTPVALLISLLVATYTLAVRRYSRGETEHLLNESLGPICAIILITGAGGMFGGVLRYSGIGEALSDSLADIGLPLIVSAFVIATTLRVAQGSATVALTTTAGLISAGVADADPSSLQLVALVLAIAAGATVLSHVNDSGFWLVGRFFGMDVRTTLRTWTVLETTLGVSIFVLALGIWAVG
ncbi:GntP family permease [Nocardioides sp. zg-1228]|uniref:GntP family permease n=1 Tax=Nocardioides sp. zg-1228 TaxID=2763008 RepID=UPI001F121CAC|nr:GntP family permease [Nocardioides sp. zg-1228]